MNWMRWVCPACDPPSTVNIPCYGEHDPQAEIALERCIELHERLTHRIHPSNGGSRR